MTADRSSQPHGPRATYRLQLGPDLDFAGAAGLVEYLAKLGVTHVYCSPVLQAREGSTHGYDVVDPTSVSRALGGEDGLRRLADAAAANGLALLVDIVPNHMGTGPENAAWESLLAEGPSGPGAAVFDVDWSPPLPGAGEKVILPVLGEPYGAALVAGALAVVDEAGNPRLRYQEHSFPLSAATRSASGRGAVADLSGIPGRPETWSRLHGLLEAQHYRLVHWRAGDGLVNYRRFFAISDLAGVRAEDPAVFAGIHGKTLDLIRAGLVDGLRVDHVDGLADPTAYLASLRTEAGEDTWIVVEKILGPGETLPAWPVAGTTGYDFLGDAIRLFVDATAEQALSEVAVAFEAWPVDVGVLTTDAKREVLVHDLAADTERLVDRFWALTQRHLEVRDVTRAACRDALVATLVAFGVYRIYTCPGTDPTPQDSRRLREAIESASGTARGVPDHVWSFLERALRGQAGDSPLHAEVLRRFHQVAGAAMAKGVEDTLLYRQHRLTALNEVGVEPDRFAGVVTDFHEANGNRAEDWPEGMLTTSTHDTKRGEDVRLRIAALSECAPAWRDVVLRWRESQRAAVRETASGPAPDLATQYLCYQTLVGVWRPGESGLERLGERVTAYLVKAAREDGRRTSWADPDAGFEEGVGAFVDFLLDDRRSGSFLDDLRILARRTGEIAMTSSLSQVLLRTTSPGAPDTYQGLELWDDSLVDPDNRRPVDFAERRRALTALDDEQPDPSALLEARADGRVKLWVLSRALRARVAHPACFGAQGGYMALDAEGRFADHVVAFARTGADGDVTITIAPRLVGPLVGDPPRPPLGDAWDDTRVLLPDRLRRRPWGDALGGAGAPAGGALALRDVLARLPVALLES